MALESNPNGVVVPATFDGVVFRPTGPVALPPNTEVVLIVEAAPVEKEIGPSFLDTAAAIDVPGPSDWATNLKAYLYGGTGPAPE